MNLRDYFKHLGWHKNSKVCLSKRYHSNGGRWRNYFMTVGELCDEIDGKPIPQDTCIYYTCGSLHWRGRRREKGCIESMKELVLDIDFKVIDADDYTVAETKAKELLAILPKPTALVHSGNGYHVHYRLYTPSVWVDFPDDNFGDFFRRLHGTNGYWRKQYTVDKGEYEAVYQRLVAYYNTQFPAYLDTCQSCEHVFRLPYTYNCKDLQNLKPVKVIETNDVKYTLDDFRKLVPDDFKCEVYKTDTEASRATIKAVCKRAVKTCGIDRSKAVFGVVNRVMELMPTVSDVTLCSVLREFPQLTERYADDTELRKDVRRIMTKTVPQAISAILPTTRMTLEDDYSLVHIEGQRQTFDSLVFSTRGSNEAKFDSMLQVYDRLWGDGTSGIISVPCSSSKTYSALIYASYVAAQLAGWNKKIWFVSEKIEDCTRNAETLTKLGARAIAYHGQPSYCKMTHIDFVNGKPCKACQTPCGAVYKYVKGLATTLNQCEVLCCTHKFLAGELAKGEAVNADLVIIDESPSLFECYELDENTIALIRQHLGKAEGCLDFLFEKEVDAKIRNVLTDKGTHKIEPLDLSEFSNAVKVAYINVKNDLWRAAEKLEAVLGFFSFFKYSTNVYGTATADGKYRFIAGSVDVSIPNAVTWVLDGSARNQLTKWQGMQIIEVPSLVTAFPNTVVKLIQGNSTKSALGKQATRDALTEAAKELKPCKSILFANKSIDGEAKKTAEAVEGALTAIGCDVINMTRGEHIGSNKGREAEANLICMSLFTDVSDYALRASLYYGTEIAEADIYGTQQRQDGKTFDYVKLNRGGFTHSQMRDVMTREMERDLYQTIMRGCIRDSADADYTVVAVVSEPATIQTLADDLPGATITCVGDDVITLWLEGKTNDEIAKATGKAKESVSRTIREFRAKIGLTD